MYLACCQVHTTFLVYDENLPADCNWDVDEARGWAKYTYFGGRVRKKKLKRTSRTGWVADLGDSCIHATYCISKDDRYIQQNIRCSYFNSCGIHTAALALRSSISVFIFNSLFMFNSVFIFGLWSACSLVPLTSLHSPPTSTDGRVIRVVGSETQCTTIGIK